MSYISVDNNVVSSDANIIIKQQGNNPSKSARQTNETETHINRKALTNLNDKKTSWQLPTNNQTDYHRTGSQKFCPVIKTIVRNLDLDHVRPKRAGIIIYTVKDGSVYFGLGVDTKTHDLTDFGGGVSYKTDNNAVRGAIREFEEESLEIFESLTFNDIEHCPVIYDKNNLIIFLHIDIDPDAVSEAFNAKYKSVMRNLESEVCAITWLTWEEFKYSIREPDIMFSRVQKFLLQAGDFSYLL